jgi:hypothetical protein
VLRTGGRLSLWISVQHLPKYAGVEEGPCKASTACYRHSRAQHKHATRGATFSAFNIPQQTTYSLTSITTLNLRPVHVGFMVDKSTMLQFFSAGTAFVPSVSLQHCLSAVSITPTLLHSQYTDQQTNTKYNKIPNKAQFISPLHVSAPECHL